MKSVLDPSLSAVMLMHTDVQATFERLLRARQETGEINPGAIDASSATAFREQKLGSAANNVPSGIFASDQVAGGGS